MDHVAIMRKSWGLTQKILSGEKTIESRWYKFRHTPWGKIKKGDTVYFKDSGEPVIIKAEVAKVLQFPNLTPKKVKEILSKFAKDDGIAREEIPNYYKMFEDKKYCLLIYLKDPQKIKPFDIDKTGFGTMASWICVNEIGQIKR